VETRKPAVGLLSKKRWRNTAEPSLWHWSGYKYFTAMQLRKPWPHNGGTRHTPHLALAVGSVVMRERIAITRRAAHVSGLPDPEYVRSILRQAMYGVTTEGTSTCVFAGAGYYRSGGKTAPWRWPISYKRQVRRAQIRRALQRDYGGQDGGVKVSVLAWICAPTGTCGGMENRGLVPPTPPDRAPCVRLFADGPHPNWQTWWRCVAAAFADRHRLGQRAAAWPPVISPRFAHSGVALVVWQSWSGECLG
jgi:hypothetical protein